MPLRRLAPPGAASSAVPGFIERVIDVLPSVDLTRLLTLRRTAAREKKYAEFYAWTETLEEIQECFKAPRSLIGDLSSATPINSANTSSLSVPSPASFGFTSSVPSAPASATPAPAPASLASTSTHALPRPRCGKKKRGTKGNARGVSQSKASLSAKHVSKAKAHVLPSFNASTTKISSTGFSGKQNTIDPLLLNNPWYRHYIVRGFSKYYYQVGGPALVLLDCALRIFLIRAHIPSFMAALHSDVVGQILWFMAATETMSIANNLVRGVHHYCILGPQRQYSPDPKLSSFQRQFPRECEMLLAPLWMGQPNPLLLLIGHIDNVLKTFAPEVHKRLSEIDDGGFPRLFGCFQMMCVNFAGVGKKVLCGPHYDWKNVPYFCAVWTFTIGKFDTQHKAWLCLHEARVLIELPPGSVAFYPSALILHYNIDVDKIQVRWTKEMADGRLQWMDDTDASASRGSIVFFTQGSMLQTSELGMPVGKARKIGIEPSSKDGNPERVDEVWEVLKAHPEFAHEM